MKFTKAAREALDRVPIDRRAEVGNYAKRIAGFEDRKVVTLADVKAAILCAGPEFLPEGETDENPSA